LKNDWLCLFVVVTQQGMAHLSPWMPTTKLSPRNEVDTKEGEVGRSFYQFMHDFKACGGTLSEEELRTVLHNSQSDIVNKYQKGEAIDLSRELLGITNCLSGATDKQSSDSDLLAKYRVRPGEENYTALERMLAIKEREKLTILEEWKLWKSTSGMTSQTPF
jgi:hypothetical protein